MIPIVISITIVLCIAGLIIIARAFKKLHKYLLIKDTPTSTIRSIAMGIVEINGRAYAKEYLETPHSRSKCVYYRYEIEEYQERTTTDSEGNTETTYEWVTIDKGRRHIPFYARDRTGEAFIDPGGAEYHVPEKKMLYHPIHGHEPRLTLGKRLSNWWHHRQTVLTKTESGLYVFYPGDEFPIYPSVGDKRSHEYYIEPGGFVYIMGTAVPTRDISGNTIIKKGRSEKTLLISNKPEEELLDEVRGSTAGFFVLGFFLIAAGLGILVYFL